MKRKEKFYKTLKVRIKKEKLTKRKERRIRKIRERDKKIIHTYLQIIKAGAQYLTITRHGRKQVNKRVLDEWTLTTSRNTSHGKRTNVRIDLKKHFPHCSHDELQECRDRAVGIYESWAEQVYLAKKNKLPAPTFPTIKDNVARLQLFNKERVKLTFHAHNTVARAWLGIRDSLDTHSTGKNRHKRLWLPLALSPYHEKEIKRGKLKAVEINYNTKEKEWWAMLVIEQTFIQDNMQSMARATTTLPPAVLGIDMGEKNTAVLSLLTPHGVLHSSEIKFVKDPEGKKKLKQIEYSIRSLQSRVAKKKNKSEAYTSVRAALDRAYARYHSYASFTLHKQIDEILSFLGPYLCRYRIYVAVGYPKFLAQTFTSQRFTRSLRKRLKRWLYLQFLVLLRRRLLTVGFAPHQLVAIDEYHTSRSCSRCHSRGARPVQSLFHCSHCGYTLHADLNASKNIARKLILTVLSSRKVYDRLTGYSYTPSFFPSFLSLGQWL